MANTNVTISSSDGLLVANPTSIPVVQGDTVAFSAAGGAAATLFFSPDALSVLSPAPSGPVKVHPGGSASFTFTSSNPGAYSVFIGSGASSAPPGFPPQGSNQLVVKIAVDQIVFDVTGPPGPKTG